MNEETDQVITVEAFNKYVTTKMTPVMVKAISRATAPLLDRIRVLEAAIRELRTAPGSDLSKLEEIRELLSAPVVGKRGPDGTLTAQRVLPPKPPTPAEKLADLEEKINQKSAYRGIWDSETEFYANDEVTDKGTTWHCKRTTRARPGTNSDWQLKVKNEGRTR